ncbi:hypothetical protein GCM10020000_28280 [Streptomyces olivoverticillatus]
MTNTEGRARREQRRGPVVRRQSQMQTGTTDQHLLDTRGTADWVHEDPFRVLRIQSEFVEGFGALAELPPRSACSARRALSGTRRSTRPGWPSGAGWSRRASR